MIFALTTRWNAHRHTDGEALIEEILSMGFRHVELGYDTRIELIPGIQRMVKADAVRVDSLHNFCPVPMGVSRAHPEIYTLADPDRRERENGVRHTANTIRMAAELGARAVVCHAGNVPMKRGTHQLLEMWEQGKQFTPAYEKARAILQEDREKVGRRSLEDLFTSLEQLLPLLQETKVRLALEILPTWEAIPTELEFEAIFRRFPGGEIAYWHDIGHSQIRQNLGFINMERWLERLQNHMAGMHLHDVIPPGRDHVMPPRGSIDFARYTRFAKRDILRVIEPTTKTPREEILEAWRVLREAWAPPTQPAASAPPPAGQEHP